MSEVGGTFLRMPCHLITTTPVPIWHLIEDDDASLLKRNSDAANDVLTAVFSLLDDVVPATDRTWIAYRGLPIDKFSAALISGVDKDPADAVIYCDSDPKRHWSTQRQRGERQARDYSTPSMVNTCESASFTFRKALRRAKSMKPGRRIHTDSPAPTTATSSQEMRTFHQATTPNTATGYLPMPEMLYSESLVRGRSEETVEAIMTTLDNVPNRAFNSW